MMYDIIVIGAGPAGASAAIFTAKAGKQTLLLENNKGMTKRAWFENYYGITEIGGPDLVDTGKKQAVRLGAELKEETVTGVSPIEGGLSVVTDQGTYEAKHVLLATGALVDLAEHIGVATKPGTEPRIKTVADVDPAGRTNIPGVWAAGTVAGVSVHAVITAATAPKWQSTSSAS